MVKYFCYILILCFVQTSVFAKNVNTINQNNTKQYTLSHDTTESLDLIDLIYLVLERNNDMKIAFNSVKVAESELSMGKYNYLPSVSAGVSYTEDDADTYLKKISSENAYISATYNIFNFGKDKSKVMALEHYLQSAKYKKDQVVQDIIYKVINSYYSLLSLYAQREALIENEKTRLEAFKAAELKYRIGLVPLVDKLKSSNSYSKSKLNRINIENNIKKQEANLNNLLNFEPNNILKLNESKINIKKINKNVDYYINESKQVRLDIKQLKEKREAKVKELLSVELGRLPSVQLNGAFYKTKNLTKCDSISCPSRKPYNSNELSIKISVPLFSGFYTVNNIKILKENIKSIDLQIEQLEKEIANEVWNAFYDFDTTQKSYFISKELLKTAEENAKVELGRYKNNKGSMLDVLNAQSQLENARYEFITSKYNLLIYRVGLLKAVGKMSLENIINIDNL